MRKHESSGSREREKSREIVEPSLRRMARDNDFDEIERMALYGEKRNSGSKDREVRKNKKEEMMGDVSEHGANPMKKGGRCKKAVGGGMRPPMGMQGSMAPPAGGKPGLPPSVLAQQHRSTARKGLIQGHDKDYSVGDLVMDATGLSSIPGLKKGGKAKTKARVKKQDGGPMAGDSAITKKVADGMVGDAANSMVSKVGQPMGKNLFMNRAQKVDYNGDNGGSMMVKKWQPFTPNSKVMPKMPVDMPSLAPKLVAMKKGGRCKKASGGVGKVRKGQYGEKDME